MAALVLALLVGPAAPVSIELAITSKVALKGDLEDLLTFGLLKEMTCDAHGNIFSPSNRKYGDAISSIVRFPHDASTYEKFSIDGLPSLDDGTITDFEVEPDDDVYVLAREVLKYSEVEVPLEFGKNFIVHYARDGAAPSQLRLKIDTKDFTPAGFAVLKNNQYLVVGYRQAKGKTFIIAELFQANGALGARVELNPNGTKTSNSERVGSARVYQPIAITANGLVYVMRGTTTEPVYVLSETGQLLRTIQLEPTGLEFDSPKILGDDLIVSAHDPSLTEPGVRDPKTGMYILRGPPRRNFPVFSLGTGQIVVKYYLREYAFGLACYAPGSLTFIGQDLSTNPSGWAIFEAAPASPANARHPATGN
jgi:hypothetical protein